MSTTYDTITKSQIRTLRTEAATAGDTILVATCDMALGGGQGDETPLGDVYRARTECARVIAEAEAKAAE